MWIPTHANTQLDDEYSVKHKMVSGDYLRFMVFFLFVNRYECVLLCFIIYTIQMGFIFVDLYNLY